MSIIVQLDGWKLWFAPLNLRSRQIHSGIKLYFLFITFWSKRYEIFNTFRSGTVVLNVRITSQSGVNQSLIDPRGAACYVFMTMKKHGNLSFDKAKPSGKTKRGKRLKYNSPQQKQNKNITMVKNKRL